MPWAQFVATNGNSLAVTFNNVKVKGFRQDNPCFTVILKHHLEFEYAKQFLCRMQPHVSHKACHEIMFAMQAGTKSRASERITGATQGGANCRIRWEVSVPSL